MIDRRTFLGATACVAAGVTLPSAVRAFRVEEMPAAAEEIYLDACSTRTFHETLRAELRALLESDELTEESRARLRRGIACPFCSCPVAPNA